MVQLVDLITASEDHVDLSKFSLQKHAFIIQYKTAYYFFYFSVALAMRICGIPESYNLNGQTIAPYEAPSSLLSANTPEQIGKIGTDIVDNKCSWCINVALSVATSEQRKILEDNYGQKNAKPEAAVKALYEEIGLRERYRVCEESAKERLDALIAKIPEPEAAVDGGYLKRGVFTSFLNKIYKRTK